MFSIYLSSEKKFKEILGRNDGSLTWLVWCEIVSFFTDCNILFDTILTH